MEYPHLEGFDFPHRDGAREAPALRHIVEIDYTKSIPDEDHLRFSASDAWKAEEEWFERELSDLSAECLEPMSIELGKVEIVKYRSRYVITLEHRWLATVPSCNPDNLDSGSLGLPRESENLINCIHIMSLDGRAKNNTRLKLVIIPGKETAFRLHLELSVSFVAPTIFEPASNRKQRYTATVEDAQRRILLFLFPPSPSPPSFQGTVNIPFYYSILGPAPFLASPVAEMAMQPAALLPTLLPFQRRTVGWLLEREGMTVSNDGKIIPKRNAGFTFWLAVDVNGEEWFLHRLSGALRLEAPISDNDVAPGGILAEEPGLGKTIETISLVLLNPALPQFNPSVTRWDPEAELDVKAIKSTLIVTPATLATQWFDELKAHAPSLKVLVYDGWNNVKVPITTAQIEKVRQERQQAKSKAKKKSARAGTKAEAEANIKKKKGKATAVDAHTMDMETDEVMDWCTYVHQFDVVITTYNVLQSDLNVARAPPTRPRRDGVVYVNVERPRSPLILVEWARVVMDEVQMAGGAKIEDMVSLIPRRSSLAVSGTPARVQVSDLSHVLKFLRFNMENRHWDRLLQPGYASNFYDLFKYYSVRSMKSQVSHELTIPQQTRFLVGIELGRVEHLVYDQSLEVILNDLGLDARGVAASDGWEVDSALLRSSIRRLRGICTHPQVGQLVGQNERLYKPGVLKTMADVLENMKDQNWRNILDDWRSKIQVLIKVAQLKHLNTQALNRFQPVLDCLLLAQKEAELMIAEIEKAIAEHDIQGEALKKEAAEQRAALDQNRASSSSGKGKAKQRSVSPLSQDEMDEDEDDDLGLPKTPAGKEHGDKRRALIHRLREARIQYHRVKFLQGDAYHNLGTKYTAQEDDAYASAEVIRRNLLKCKSTEQDAKDGMALLKLDLIGGRSGVDKESLLIPVPYLEEGGIRSADLIEELHELIENVLNEQTELLWEWRSKIHELLTQNLTSGDDDADGQEYQRTLDNQGEAETYLQAYAALLADRREALTNERTLLAAHDAKETKQRITKAALKAMAVDTLDIPADIDIQPEHEVLFKQLSDQRKALLLDLNGRAVRSILVNLTGAHSRTAQNDPERLLLTVAIADLRKLIGSQQTMMDKVSADLALFRKAFNQRVLYFRQLQEISDSVADVEFEGTKEDALNYSEKEIKDLDSQITAKRAHLRYLNHLVKSNEEDEMDEEDKLCVLCRCDFERGFITTCAHIFCEGCLKEWMGKKDGKTCPVCRVTIDSENLQRFTLQGQQPPPKPMVNGELIPTSRRKIEYNIIDATVFEAVQSMEAIGDYGTKIQTLVRHLLYLEQVDPGSKSIIFSAWADSLTILERALHENGIISIRIDRGTRGEGPVKKFKSHPEISVLLLHGERENAGLNVTCASRVFLLESVVHHGFEIQAIARIDRLGQTRATEVYCYYAEDTVERNILDLAARQGLSLYTKENSAGSLNVSSFANDKQIIDSPSKKNTKAGKGDFISKVDDMLAILFPHMFEDVEYLLPSEDLVMSDVTNVHDDAQQGGSRTTWKGKGRAIQENAVAGPSRLRC
ncbi:SNF2 family N-terminal domain-containing protein [Rhodocollybia butyracea]|uniref:SNF2 family N-terminal domain-containing protein n=1 Tax=Rhodocollybia butyracea TaxID=206335 RepID=A0A9P5U3F6_9AGAR|nr:SNF2 family N-terminal domain-containing protein [Rhodocollybia butyracea]